MNYKVFLWENGAKSTEYTRYMIAPFFYKDNLDETLDEGEIVLESMPIDTKTAFPPKTKFRVEKYILPDYSGEIELYDIEVEQDNVEEFIGEPDICTHRIVFTEVSVAAQGMHADNIALTYELQDVTLNYKTTISDDTLVSINNNGNGVNGGLINNPIRLTQSLEYTTYIIGDGGGGNA